ncbi:hypothetical protein FA13DRAFT_1805958 [Coprinellus micaceus]|uniref:Uncharacterized protein n=1 Tax=Coprinellus micaceus TaxID=71717 RepID=A0A4Y7RTU8_COPMI|nr:hypothetical protein FA13DRAFT_1805958 [Coprinellus micaceus]
MDMEATSEDITAPRLVDLARQATNPRTLAQIASHSGAHSAGSSSPGSPVLRPQTPTGGPAGVGSQVAPATFTPLPDDIYLPFLDRPAEVAALISTVPDAKLFALLSQTLPKEYIGPAYESLSSPLPPSNLEASVSPPALSSSVSTTSSSAPLTSPAPFATFPSAVSDPTFLLLLTLPPDPALWTHAHLLTHLTVIDRNYAPDPVWVPPPAAASARTAN